MNYLKDNPVGIDVNIDRIQKRIHDPLEAKWGSIDVYGRVYKKSDNKGKVRLERYLGNGEYGKVLFSEGNKIFFVQGSSPDISSGVASNDLWVVCVVNIEDIKNIQHRADEEIHTDLISEVSRAVELRGITGIEYGMNNLKRVVEDVFEFGNFKYSDIHPYHVFMVKLKVEYALIENNC